MVQIDFQRRMLRLRVLYAGAPGAGVTSNLNALSGFHAQPLRRRGRGQQLTLWLPAQEPLEPELLLLPPHGELPPGAVNAHGRLAVGRVGGLGVEVQLIADSIDVPQGVDGVVFVVDSGGCLTCSYGHVQRLAVGLREQGLQPETLPAVLQWNKRDRPDVRHAEELDAALNPLAYPTCGAIASVGFGVRRALQLVLAQVHQKLNQRYCSCMFDPDGLHLPCLESALVSAQLGSALGPVSRTWESAFPPGGAVPRVGSATPGRPRTRIPPKCSCLYPST